MGDNEGEEKYTKPTNAENSKAPAQGSIATGDAARRAEHRYLSALAIHAGNTNSLEITRPTITNCPDGGHDLNVRGAADEIKELVSGLTGTPVDELSFLDKSAKDGNLKIRIDVKGGKFISGDVIDSHASNSSRSPDCQINLLTLTNPNCKVTPEAQKKLANHRNLFRRNGTLVDIVEAKGLERIEEMNNKKKTTEGR